MLSSPYFPQGDALEFGRVYIVRVQMFEQKTPMAVYAKTLYHNVSIDVALQFDGQWSPSSAGIQHKECAKCKCHDDDDDDDDVFIFTCAPVLGHMTQGDLFTDRQV